MEKIIHQMWFQGFDQVPKHYRLLMDSWQENHPEYKYVFWDETTINSLLEENFPDYLASWNSLDKMIKKCDSARYFILYRYGGVYADLDTRSFRSIDGLLNNLQLNDFSIVLSEESYDPLAWKSEVAKQLKQQSHFDVVIGNAILISKKEQAFWLSFLEKGFELRNESVLESFSTWHLTRYLSNWPNRSEIAIVPAHHLLSTMYTDENTYAIHNYDATWFDHTKAIPWEG